MLLLLLLALFPLPLLPGRLRGVLVIAEFVPGTPPKVDGMRNNAEFMR